MRVLLLLLNCSLCVCVSVISVFAIEITKTQKEDRILIGVLDFGETPIGKSAAEAVRQKFRSTSELTVADPDLTRAAAKGIGYAGSLNLSLSEARDLGSALATEFYVLGDAQTVRRSSFQSPVYYESYCSMFLVSARTGQLLFWERPSFESEQASIAEAQLAEYLSGEIPARRLIGIIKKARVEELILLRVFPAIPEAVIEEAPDDEKTAEDQGIRLPRPYRRLRPEYPASAARADAEATVDVLVYVLDDGEVGELEIARWAGFGLDEATLAVVRQLQFFPAMKNGTRIPMRVLLRYNFRKPPR